MDKFELKEKLIDLVETLEQLTGSLMSTGAADEETARIRSKVFSELAKVSEMLHEDIYNIY